MQSGFNNYHKPSSVDVSDFGRNVDFFCGVFAESKFFDALSVQPGLACTDGVCTASAMRVKSSTPAKPEWSGL